MAPPEELPISVLLFGPLAAAAGFGAAELRVPAPATVGDALSALAAAHPALVGRLERVATAVNEAYVARSHPLGPADRLALIPPVSGG